MSRILSASFQWEDGVATTTMTNDDDDGPATAVLPPKLCAQPVGGPEILWNYKQSFKGPGRYIVAGGWPVGRYEPTTRRGNVQGGVEEGGHRLQGDARVRALVGSIDGGNGGNSGGPKAVGLGHVRPGNDKAGARNLLFGRRYTLPRPLYIPTPNPSLSMERPILCI